MKPPCEVNAKILIVQHTPTHIHTITYILLPYRIEEKEKESPILQFMMLNSAEAVEPEGLTSPIQLSTCSFNVSSSQFLTVS
jgi:hypothetical protein